MACKFVLLEFTRSGQKLNAKSTLSTLILQGNCKVYLRTSVYFRYKAPDWSIQVRSYAKSQVQAVQVDPHCIVSLIFNSGDLVFVG